ncbi:MAG: hypothetical protein ACR2NF_01115 [Pirellulales bacterium]
MSQTTCISKDAFSLDFAAHLSYFGYNVKKSDDNENLFRVYKSDTWQFSYTIQNDDYVALHAFRHFYSSRIDKRKILFELNNFKNSGGTISNAILVEGEDPSASHIHISTQLPYAYDRTHFGQLIEAWKDELAEVEKIWADNWVDKDPEESEKE